MVGMTGSPRYKAFWLPGLVHDIDQGESLTLALRWLAAAERDFTAAGVIVMFAKKMMYNDPLLRQAASRWEFVSPRSQRPKGRGPVLAVWPPNADVLDLAERLAIDTALCVVAGRWDISGWVARTRAECLIDSYEIPPSYESLPADAIDALDSIIFFDGHNGFIGAGGKEHAIRHLRIIASLSDRPEPEAIESYLVASGEVERHGVSRASKWYAEILQGMQHRDYAGRIIS